MRLIRRQVPVTESEEESRNGMYVFADNYTAFWFKFVNPFMSSLQIGVSDGAMASWRTHFIEHHVSFVFEEICRRSAYSMEDDIGFVPSRVGRYWRNGIAAVDVLALDDDGKMAFAANCRLNTDRPVGMSELDALKNACGNMGDLEGCEVVYGLFSATGFEEVLYSSDAILIDKGEIVYKPGLDHSQSPYQMRL